ncbi:MAG: hypothetical protein WCE64_08605, partial [Bacteroidales bacterium]
MKTKTSQLLILLLILFIAGIRTGFSQQNKITIQSSSSDKQLLFAADEIKKAAAEKGIVVTQSRTLNSKSIDGMIIKIISDSVSAVKVAGGEILKMPQQFGWQCYSIRTKKTGNQEIIYILAGDKT